MSNGAKLKKLRPNRRNRKKNPIHTITYMKKKKYNRKKMLYFYERYETTTNLDLYEFY